MTTKEKILDAALTLFSGNGYDGTSMEEIAGLVGIKAPSVYKHFKGKEDILNSLIDAAEARYENNFGSEDKIGKVPDDLEEFMDDTMGRVHFTMSDPMIRKVRRFLVKEQFRNERLAQVTTAHQEVGLQKMYQKIIEAMTEKGLLIRDDPKLLSAQLTAYPALLVERVDRQPEYLEEALKELEDHLRHFCRIYGAGKD